MQIIAPGHLAIASVLALATSTCADNNTSIYVEAVLLLSPPSCEVTADPGSTQLLRGTLDVAFLRSYEAALLVANQLTPRGDKEQLRAETQGIQLRGAEVQLSTADGALLDEFSVPTGGFVHPSDSQAPGYGTALVTVIPPARGQAFFEALSAGARGEVRTVVASVRVFGETSGGIEVTSGAFTFPIDVCFGCLVEFPLEAIEDTGNGRVCSGAADGVTTSQCLRGQDQKIDCRTCASTMALCAQLDN
ncbi:MAG: hypothetical protein RJA70_34 [Pseudomonadota bacterium]|jgi:hypothetical protein